MAAELGCSPEALLDLDLALFNETAKAVTEKRQREVEEAGWTQDTELLATACELIHAQLVSFIKANSSDPVSLEPLHIPRPARLESESESKELPVTPHEDIIRLAVQGGAL